VLAVHDRDDTDCYPALMNAVDVSGIPQLDELGDFVFIVEPDAHDDGRDEVLVCRP